MCCTRVVSIEDLRECGVSMGFCLHCVVLCVVVGCVALFQQVVLNGNGIVVVAHVQWGRSRLSAVYSS